ncbi:MAG: zinc-finger family protein [Pseudomonas sp.]|nr:zinc-finger family protein [Pseudomonas sp.]
MNELNCELCHELMHGYLDNELDKPTHLGFTEHLASCADCRQRLQEMQLLKTAVKAQASYYSAPASLTDSLRASLQLPAQPLPLPEAKAKAKVDRWRTLRDWFAPIISAGVFAAALALYIATPTVDDNWADEAVSSHVRSLMGEHLMDVASSDKHTVKPWFTGKLDFSPPVYDFAAQGFPLLGGRLDYLQHQTAAALSYRHDKHIINTFVVPTSEPDSPAQTESRRGYNIVTWRQNHMRFIVVSDMDKGELEAFSQLTQKGL